MLVRYMHIESNEHCRDFYSYSRIGEKNMNKVKSDGDKTTTLQSDSGALNLFFVEESTW